MPRTATDEARSSVKERVPADGTLEYGAGKEPRCTSGGNQQNTAGTEQVVAVGDADAGTARTALEKHVHDVSLRQKK